MLKLFGFSLSFFAILLVLDTTVQSKIINGQFHYIITQDNQTFKCKEKDFLLLNTTDNYFFFECTDKNNNKIKHLTVSMDRSTIQEI